MLNGIIGEPQTFYIMPCPDRSKNKNFCDGQYNGYRCPIKYAFFGLVEAQHGWKERENFSCETDSCPEIVEWVIPWQERNELIVLIGGGRPEGFTGKKEAPCAYITAQGTNPEVMCVLKELFDLTLYGNRAITKYLQSRLNAPKNIRELALKRCSRKNIPRLEDIS